MIDQLCFKKFGDVEDDGEQQSREDESEKMYQGRRADPVFSVKKGFANNKISLCCYAHDEVGFPGEHYVLQRVVEVGEKIYEDHIFETDGRLDNSEDQK